MSITWGDNIKMELTEISLVECEMHRTGLELCLMASFGIINIEPLSTATGILLGVISQSRMDNPLRIDKDNACDGEKNFVVQLICP
jgi:hypothetical protein